ncbi:MAG: WG repeat-containing protein, partial [Bryobacteraceae bacterium]
KKGILLIPPKYSDAQSFSDGLALVWPSQNLSAEGLFGYYIDKTGSKALTLLERPFWPFSGGLTVAGSPGTRHYIDLRARVVAPYEVNPRP